MFDVLNFVFEYPFEFLSIVIAIAAFIFARKALNQAKALRARLDLFETAARKSASPPPIPTPWVGEPSVAAIVAEVAETEAAAQPSPPESTPAPRPIPEVATSPSAPQAGPGFEERLGTRWVVW